MGAHKLNPFARGTAAPPTSLDVHDAFGRILHPGDLVALTSPPGLMGMRIVEITPNLDPSAPPHTMKVTLLVHLPMVVRANQPTQQIVRVLSAAEAGLEAKEAPVAPDKETSISID